MVEVEKTHQAQRAMRKLSQVNLRGILSWFLFLLLLAIGAYFMYMKMEIKRLDAVIVSKEKVLEEKERELKSISANKFYKKYQASKIIEEVGATISWKNTISYLIDIYDRVAAVDDTLAWIELTDFSVSLEHKVNLRGTASSIRNIYVPDWLLDQFTILDFVEHVHIPFYRKSETAENFDFILEAIISPDE